jgi:hypothetical protein
MLIAEKDQAVASEHDTEIHELCKGTTLALQELRHGIASVLLDTLQKMEFDVRTLVHLLDECPGQVRKLLNGDTDGLTTEMMIQYLEIIRR